MPHREVKVASHPVPDLYWYKVKVAKAWTDGDTLKVNIDFGLDEQRNNAKLRLARIDAFGSNSPKKKLAIAFCNQVLPVGAEFYLQTVRDKTEKWGRFLAEVWLGDGSDTLMNFNDILVKQGLAMYWDGQGEHPTGEVVSS